MGSYIRPASLVEKKGRKIPADMSWKAARAELQPGERLAGFIKAGDNKLAPLIAGEADFETMRDADADIYIIDKEVASQAP